MKTKPSTNLVCQYLENISRAALEEHQRVIRKYVRHRQGIYALYRRNKLYYVGLASNLRSRLQTHLRDHHKGTWDSFSVYITVGDQHMRELETLILRMVKPRGNKQKGKFSYADDLRRQFRRDIVREQSIQLEALFCGEARGRRRRALRELKGVSEGGRRSTLAPFVTRRFHIRGRHKGKLYIAHVRKNGTIMFAAESAEFKRLKGKVFQSPSVAAMTALRRSSWNGWTWWAYERAPGDWVKLDKLRK